MGCCFRILERSSIQRMDAVYHVDLDMMCIGEYGSPYQGLHRTLNTLNDIYDTYHRILLEIVRYGIENNFRTIDFGQTADESKLKLGSEYTMLYAYLHHSNPLVNAINRKLAKYIEYKPITTEYRVFK